MIKLSSILFLLGFSLSFSQIAAAADPVVCAVLVKAKAPQEVLQLNGCLGGSWSSGGHGGSWGPGQPAGTSVEQDINSFCRNETKYPKRCKDQIWQIVAKSHQSIPDYGHQTDQCQLREDHRVINLTTNTLIAPYNGEKLPAFIDRLKKENRCEFVPVRCEIASTTTPETFKLGNDNKISGCSDYQEFYLKINGKTSNSFTGGYYCYNYDGSITQLGNSSASKLAQDQYNEFINYGVCN